MKRICKNCGYIDTSENELCPVCQKNDWDDYDIYQIKKFSTDESFIDAMIKLKSDNPIEFQLKLNQFKLQQEQNKAIKEKQRTQNKVHCPYCNSINVKKISNTAKAVHTALFGIFSISRNSKQWHCNNCNSDF